MIRLRDRQPQLADEIEEEVLTSGIRFVPPNVEQARLAARARLRYPLNLGDCFAYALAKDEGCPILTADRDFRRVDVPVVLPPDVTAEESPAGAGPAFAPRIFIEVFSAVTFICQTGYRHARR